MSKTVKTSPPKWAIVATWRRYRLFRTKQEAEARLREWSAEHEARGWKVSGSLSSGYTAVQRGAERGVQLARARAGLEPVGIESARVVKLADHPICYIGVDENSVCELRRLEEADDTSFPALSARAKMRSRRWELDEAL